MGIQKVPEASPAATGARVVLDDKNTSSGSFTQMTFASTAYTIREVTSREVLSSSRRPAYTCSVPAATSALRTRMITSSSVTRLTQPLSRRSTDTFKRQIARPLFAVTPQSPCGSPPQMSSVCFTRALKESSERTLVSLGFNE